MKEDFSKLQEELDALVIQATATEGTEASAKVVIDGFASAVETAVTAALEANAVADQSSIDAAKAAIASTRERFAASAAALGASIPATPSPNPGGEV